MYIKVSVIAIMAATALTATAQTPVAVGYGSYASSTPLSKGRTDAHPGDLSTFMATKQLWVNEQPGRPIPTNDWWTGLINAPFADALWSYPAMVHPSESGVTVNYPSYWNDNGTEVKWRSSITVGGDGFNAVSAIADDWHDWDVEMLLTDGADASMRVTLAHGIPFTWIETTGIAPRLMMSDAAEYFTAEGDKIAAIDLKDLKTNILGISIGSDVYGVYLPNGARVKAVNNRLDVDLTDADGEYVIIGLLPSTSDLDSYATYAYNVPRSTRVGWHYNSAKGEISSTWSVEAENLSDASIGGDVMQGFLPHQWKGAEKSPAFTGTTYLTPRGTMKMAAGNSFTFSHHFAGMLPWYAHPSADDSAVNPFRSSVLSQLTAEYAARGSFGDDTYWGGKGLVQMALNMTFALQNGDTEAYELSRSKLRAKLIDWLTYTPGEDRVYFAFYPRWGGLVGEDPSYDSDTFNDHHFHYGYFTLAGAILCMVDEDFRQGYGEMLKLVAKDYANWDRNDSRFPFLRTMDPWVGHSYAGGLGDQGNSNGNGQESSSESIQGWGGVYLLGVALGDDEMRDAGIFGWTTEARATREYWFDVDSRFDKHGLGGNYDYSLYKYPYNTNITCKGIGWWTWFSGDPLHMHGIQWLPISPALDYLSWDRDFVAWAYNDLMNTPGWVHDWFVDGTAPNGDRLNRLANDDWGNVVLSYMQRAYPDEAAAIFDEAIERGEGIATNISTGHISYYAIHSHLTYGEIDLTAHADIPSANLFVDKNGHETYIVYNPGAQREVTFYRDGVQIGRFTAPARRFTVFDGAAYPVNIEIHSATGSKTLTELSLEATVTDQYGATVDGCNVVWSVDNAANCSISDRGILTVASQAPKGQQITVTAALESNPEVKAQFMVTVAEPSYPAAIRIYPQSMTVECGTPIEISAQVVDQYSEPMPDRITWIIDGTETLSQAIDTTIPGKHSVEARCGEVSAAADYFVAPKLPNLAQGRQAVSSSEENAGTLTSSVNDGYRSTRWGSAHGDGEWVYIDLGADCTITSVTIDWEAAFASDYVIQTAPDGAKKQSYTGNYTTGTETLQIVAEDQWTDAATVSGLTSASKIVTTVAATARYVRMKCLRRGSQYGVSILEFEVNGISADASANTLIGISIESQSEQFTEDTTARFNAVGYTAAGESTSVDVTWSCDRGTITADGVLTPDGYGIHSITATTTEGFSSLREVYVNEVIRLASLSVNPSTVTIIEGESAHIEVSGQNQFGGIYPLAGALTWSSDSALRCDTATSTVTCDKEGTYLLTLTAGTLSAEVEVNVVALCKYNLALNRPVTASSVEQPHVGERAVDGDLTTRWGSLFMDDQWIMVDLGAQYNLREIIVTTNDAAYASKAIIECSADGETWDVIDIRTMDSIGVDAIPAQGFAGRYIRYTCLKRATGYGTSIAELEVYGDSRVEDSPSSGMAVTAEDEGLWMVYDLHGHHLTAVPSISDAHARLASGIYLLARPTQRRLLIVR